MNILRKYIEKIIVENQKTPTIDLLNQYISIRRVNEIGPLGIYFTNLSEPPRWELSSKDARGYGTSVRVKDILEALINSDVIQLEVIPAKNAVPVKILVKKVRKK